MRNYFITAILAVAFVLSACAQTENTDNAAQQGNAAESVAKQGNDSVNVVILGDSNTWIGGDDCDKPKGWNYWFRRFFAPATCKSYARSGATWTNTNVTKYNVEENIGRLGNDNVIYNQVCRLKNAVGSGSQVKPDLIIIGCGTNDAWFLSKRPKALDTTADQAFAYRGGLITSKKPSQVLSLAESVRYNCEILMEAFPEAQIILLAPLQTTATSPELIRKTAEIIEGCGSHLSLNVIRLDRDAGIYATQEKVAFRYTYDGTHTSEAGARRIGAYVARQVGTMLNM